MNEPEWVLGLKQFVRWSRPVAFTPGYFVAAALSVALLVLCGLFAFGSALLAALRPVRKRNESGVGEYRV